MKGVAESTMVGILKQERFKPRLSGQAKDRKNSLTETKYCHVTQLQKATIDAAS